MPGENPRSIADGAMADETYCLDESERIKYLRAVVARLGIKNQRIRFELHAAAQKIEQIKKFLFELRDHPVNRSVDLEFLFLLRDLRWASESRSQNRSEMLQACRAWMRRRKNSRRLPSGWGFAGSEQLATLGIRN